MRGHGHPHFDANHVAAALEVEAQAAVELTSEAIALCADRFAEQGVTVERVIDLGCGPGVDTVQLAQRFPTAEVVAADGSRTMLARVEERAERLGLADRIETAFIDLNGELDALGRCDLVWAALAIHHSEDQIATLKQVRGRLRPTGLLCLLERADPMSVRLGPSDRLEAPQGPLDADNYPDMLAAAGLELLTARTLARTVPVPPDEATRTVLAKRVRASGRKDADWHCATVTSSRRLFLAAPTPPRARRRGLPRHGRR